jgi:fatty-acid desaturase
MSRLVLLFLLSSMAFAVVHLVATAGSLYWYYWWFDIMMHSWGGMLLGLGVHALCRLKSVPLRPTLSLVLGMITAAAITWELFEWITGLYNPVSYVADTALDVVLAFGGGLLAHFTLRHLYNRKI